MVALPARTAEPPARPRPAARTTNLPAQPTPLVGRETDVATITARLLEPDVRLLTLTGPPGTGKTRLAHAVAAELLVDFTDGVWFVALETVREADEVLAAIAQPLGVRETANRPLGASLIASLAEKHLLLVLDNFEQVLAAGVEVAALLGACPRLKVLATSRAPLRLRWEHELSVAPLALPDPARPNDAAAGAESPAVQLFSERAGAVLPDFHVSAENAGPVAEICRRLDGLPLAIELAAARIKLLTPATLRDRLENRLHVLTSGARDLSARHQTLRAALEWSYDLLSPEERTLFRGLGVFAGGCTLAAAAAIAGPRSEDGEDEGPNEEVQAQSLHRESRVLDLLSSLLDHSLIRRVQGPGGEPRYRLLETVREYAAHRLAESIDAEVARARHAAYFLILAEQAETELRGPAQGDWLARLEAEHDNLRVALGWALATGEAEIGARIGAAVGRFWERHGYAAEGRRWLERFLGTGAYIQPHWRAKAMQTSGTLALAQGDYPSARASLTACLALRQELGDLRDIAVTLNGLGNIAYQQGDYGEARRCYEQSLALLRELGDGWRIGIALNNLANVASGLGEFAAARALYEEGLALARELGDAIHIADVLQNLGELAHRQGDDTAARSFYEEGLSQQRALGDKRAMGVTLCNLGELALQQGDTAAARALLAESLTLRRELGDKRGLGLTFSALAALSRREGDLAGARVLLAESLTLRQEIGDKPGLADCLVQRAAVASAQGDRVTAVRLFGAAEALRATIGAPLAASARVEHDREVANQRAALGETAFAALWEEGRSTSLEDAIALALTLTPATVEASVARAVISPDAEPRQSRRALPDGLTAREAEVLRLIAAGQTNREIAAALVLSVATVERHIANLYAKIDARGRADATAFALRHRLA